MPETLSDQLRQIAKKLDEVEANKKALKLQKAQAKLDQQLVQYAGLSGGFLGCIWGYSRTIDRCLRSDTLLSTLKKAPARERLFLRAGMQGAVAGLAGAVLLGSVAKLVAMLPSAPVPEPLNTTATESSPPPRPS